MTNNSGGALRVCLRAIIPAVAIPFKLIYQGINSFIRDDMTNSKRTRPIGITVLTIFVFALTAWNGLRFGESLFFWNTLKAYDVSPLYISISGGTWCMIGLVLTWNLWQGKARSWIAVLCASAGYTLWYWLDRLVFQNYHSNWPFILPTNIVLILLELWILFSRRGRHFFKKDANEQ